MSSCQPNPCVRSRHLFRLQTAVIWGSPWFVREQGYIPKCCEAKPLDHYSTLSTRNTKLSTSITSRGKLPRNKFPLLKQRRNEIARQLGWPARRRRGGGREGGRDGGREGGTDDSTHSRSVIGLINFRAGCEKIERRSGKSLNRQSL